MKKIFSPAYSLKLKNIILLLNRDLIFFWMVIIASLFRRCPTLWKSTLKTTTLFRRCLTLFNSKIEIHKVISTLLNVVNFHVDVHNVVSTLIWRCATLRRHINLKTTLNRRWNVFWKEISFNFSKDIHLITVVWKTWSERKSRIDMNHFQN